MKYSKTLIVASAITGAVGIAGISTTAMAATSNSDYPPIVQKLADKFHLNPMDVQQVFKDEQATHNKDRQQKLEDKLTAAVKDGKLTEDQKTKLLAKLDSLKSEFKTENHQDRMANHQKLHDELEAWAKDNGITNLDTILPAPPAGPHGGMMRY